MTLAPLFDAPFVIQIHALAAITAFAVGLVQLTAPKGTIPHRLIGWSWVMLMLTIAVSSLFIHKIRLWGPWSPIHLLSILVLVTLPLAVMHARRHDVAQHRMAMLMLFTGALVIAGGFPSCPAGSCTPWYSAHPRQPLHEAAPRLSDVLGRAGERETHPIAAMDR